MIENNTDNSLLLFKLLVPEMLPVFQKRYTILRTINYNQPIGRRLLAERLALGERGVRSEIDFLKDHNLLESNAAGVSLTEEGKKLLPQLSLLIHKVEGLAPLENYLAQKLDLTKVVIVPGDADQNCEILHELGQASGAFLRDVVQDQWVIAVTGGTTMAEVAHNIPQTVGKKDVLVVPGRGGLGEDVEIQSNTIAAEIAQRLGASYRLLHVPDGIQNETLEPLLSDHKVQEVINLSKKANLLVHGIGIPEVMALRRDSDWQSIQRYSRKEPVGEAFGTYFAADGSVALVTPTVGPKVEDIAKLDMVVAVAGGKSKADAIMSVLRASFVDVLIVDQGAAEVIKKQIEE